MNLSLVKHFSYIIILSFSLITYASDDDSEDKNCKPVFIVINSDRSPIDEEMISSNTYKGFHHRIPDPITEKERRADVKKRRVYAKNMYLSKLDSKLQVDQPDPPRHFTSIKEYAKNYSYRQHSQQNSSKVDELGSSHLNTSSLEPKPSNKPVYISEFQIKIFFRKVTDADLELAENMINEFLEPLNKTISEQTVDIQSIKGTFLKKDTHKSKSLKEKFFQLYIDNLRFRTWFAKLQIFIMLELLSELTIIDFNNLQQLLLEEARVSSWVKFFKEYVNNKKFIKWSHKVISTMTNVSDEHTDS